jgi:AcrR family transcriptional regulator
MARRADHTREELAGLVVRAAEKLARKDGLRGVAMRRIATAIGYAPGSIYNAVGDLDEVVLRVNARTLERLRQHLGRMVDPARHPIENALAVGEGYLDFVMRQPRLWGLILEHVLPKGSEFPPWYEAALAETTRLVDDVLKPLIKDDGERRRSVATLWASLHGLASLATSGKLAVVDKDDPRAMARLLIERFLKGVAQAEAARAEPCETPR